MSRQYAHYKLHASKRPAKSDALSTTIAIRAPDGKDYYCFAGFSDKLVEYVGKKLPRGVSSFSPAFLSVLYNKNRGVWEVWASYVAGDPMSPKDNVKLWEDTQQPKWITFYPLKEDKNGTAV